MSLSINLAFFAYIFPLFDRSQLAFSAAPIPNSASPFHIYQK
jgi:hypothetical protein